MPQKLTFFSVSEKSRRRSKIDKPPSNDYTLSSCYIWEKHIGSSCVCAKKEQDQFLLCVFNCIKLLQLEFLYKLETCLIWNPEVEITCLSVLSNSIEKGSNKCSISTIICNKKRKHVNTGKPSPSSPNLKVLHYM